MATITDDILDVLFKAGKPVTATKMAHEVGARWSTTSSIMYKLMKKGVLKRVPGAGPRGGYGYVISPEVLQG